MLEVYNGDFKFVCSHLTIELIKEIVVFYGTKKLRTPNEFFKNTPNIK